MSVILFEGDYVRPRGSTVYSRVVDILDSDRVLLASGETITADSHSVADYCSESEYWFSEVAHTVYDPRREA